MEIRIWVDADACPVVAIIEKIAAVQGLPVTLLCDTAHELRSDYSTVIHIDKGADSVDLALINRCRRGDIVVTQDYGVAAMALGKGAFVLHQSGRPYTEDNIDRMLFERHLSKKMRRSSGKHGLKGPPRRTKEDDLRFEEAFEKLVLQAKSETQ